MSKLDSGDPENSRPPLRLLWSNWITKQDKDHLYTSFHVLSHLSTSHLSVLAHHFTHLCIFFSSLRWLFFLLLLMSSYVFLLVRSDAEEEGELEPAKELIQPIAEKLMAKYKAKEEEMPLLFFVAGEVR